MRRIIPILLLFCATRGFGELITNDNTTLVLFASSYDCYPYHYFGDYVGSWVALNYPQFTNHWNSASRSGGSIEDANETRLERLGLPHWANGQRAIGLIMADDNGGYTSNEVRVQLTNTFSAPELFYNGTEYTNEAGWCSTQSITWVGIGAIPHDGDGGDDGEIQRNAAVVQMCADVGLLAIDMWNPLWNGGWAADEENGTHYLGFYPGSHPYASGSLAMAITIASSLAGGDTNVSLATVDWDSGDVVSTDHCVIGDGIRDGNSLTFSRLDDRLPMAWDVPDGTITNDCRNAFVAMPQLADAFQFTIAVSNLPQGDYTVSIDGELVAVLSSDVLANGWNMFTNTVGPYWRQRQEVLGRIRDKNGADRVTLMDHSAGISGPYGADLVNFNSNAEAKWQLGKRGDALVSSLSAITGTLSIYDSRIHDAAQPAIHVFTITRRLRRIRVLKRTY